MPVSWRFDAGLLFLDSDEGATFEGWSKAVKAETAEMFGAGEAVDCRVFEDRGLGARRRRVRTHRRGAPGSLGSAVPDAC
jgi:hypothetical protein